MIESLRNRFRPRRRVGSTSSMLIDDLRRAVHAHITSRPVILIGADLDRLGQHIHELRSMGAQKVLIVTSGVGTGPVPDLDRYEVVFVDVFDGSPTLHGEAAWQEIFTNPPEFLARKLAHFDPQYRAAVIPWRFRTNAMLGDRVVYGPRLPAAVQLEDKTRIGAFLEACGVAGPPGARTALANLAALSAAADDVDLGMGTVWSGDATEATNSGTKFVRWVRNDDDRRSAAEFFGAHCREVRVAPFLEGVACGMHAFVTRRGTAVFRPVELLILRPECGSAFIDAGFSTTFDPAPSDTEAYRAIVERIGNAMWHAYGYEGALSVDAILTENGWVVHDINPRQGGGLVYVRDVLPDLPIHLLHHVAAAGDLGEIDVERLSLEVIEAANRTRVVASAVTLNGGPGSAFCTPLALSDGELVEVSYAAGSLGRSRLEIRPQVVPGQRTAPRVAAAVSAVRFDVGLGSLVSAPLDIRSPWSATREAPGIPKFSTQADWRDDSLGVGAGGS